MRKSRFTEQQIIEMIKPHLSGVIRVGYLGREGREQDLIQLGAPHAVAYPVHREPIRRSATVLVRAGDRPSPCDIPTLL